MRLAGINLKETLLEASNHLVSLNSPKADEMGRAWMPIA